MLHPTPTPVERFANFVRWLTLAVTDLSGGDRLSHFLIGLITDRLREIKFRFNRLAARVEAGTYAPRRCGPRRKSDHPRPRMPGKLPTQRGWLVPLLPRAVEFRGHLDGMLQEPATAALLAAAPASLARPIRSLCWMLRLDPPAILATAKPAAAPPTSPPAPQAGPKPPPPSPPPATSTASRPRRPPPPRACGPPRPA